MAHQPQDNTTNNEVRSQLGVPQSRRSSLASSMGSEFSHATAADIASCEQDWEKLLQFRKEAEEIFTKADKLLNDMAAACTIQSNVNRTVKDGIPALEELFDRLRDLHKKEVAQQDLYHLVCIILLSIIQN